MLSVTSTTEHAVSGAAPAVPLAAPLVTSSVVTGIRQTSVIRQLHPSTAVDSCSQQPSTKRSTTDCHGHKIPQSQKSRVVVHDKQISCSSTLFCDKMSRKAASISRPITQMGRNRQKTSVAVRVTSAHRVIMPAAAAAAATNSNHRSNVSTTASTVDAKTRLRAVILSGSRHQQPQNGNSTVCHLCCIFSHVVCLWALWFNNFHVTNYSHFPLCNVLREIWGVIQIHRKFLWVFQSVIYWFIWYTVFISPCKHHVLDIFQGGYFPGGFSLILFLKRSFGG